MRIYIYGEVVGILMRIITVKIPEAYVRELDELVRLGIYPSRSEAIRVALRELLKKELYNQAGEGDVQRAVRIQSRHLLKRKGYTYDY